MTVFVDGDGCPVVRIAERLCREFAVPCTIVCDTSHALVSDYAAVLVCDRGADSADYRIVSLLQPGDLCITQDYGLAAAIGILVFVICATLSLIVYNNSKSMKDEEAFS